MQTYYDLSEGIKHSSSFVYKRSGNEFAVSWWVSPKRTRSYPYARVYNTLQFSKGKIVTIIPIMKDEGVDGDRDFIQWDTVALMSLLGVYVIIGYYVKATKNPKYKNKVTSQEFDYEHLEKKFDELSNYRSDALHWNMNELSNLRQIGEKALESYKRISSETKVTFHDLASARKRIEKVMSDVEAFKNFSRALSLKAQHRESITRQPKERTYGNKGTIDIKNYLGGFYHFTVDEVFFDSKKNKVCLIEAKNTKNSALPSEDDIKDGLLKMILYTNLKDLYYISEKQEKIKVNDFTPMLRLTTEKEVNMSNKDYTVLKSLLEEAKENHFEILFNNKKVNNFINNNLELIEFIC
ncbi:MAG: hypothetical protein RXR17_06845 [Sulfolobaceae archaeon]